MEEFSVAATVCVGAGLCRIVLRSCIIVKIVDDFLCVITWSTVVVHIVLFAVGSLKFCRGPLIDGKCDRSNIKDSLGVAS